MKANLQSLRMTIVMTKDLLLSCGQFQDEIVVYLDSFSTQTLKRHLWMNLEWQKATSYLALPLSDPRTAGHLEDTRWLNQRHFSRVLDIIHQTQAQMSPSDRALVLSLY